MRSNGRDRWFGCSRCRYPSRTARRSPPARVGIALRHANVGVIELLLHELEAPCRTPRTTYERGAARVTSVGRAKVARDARASEVDRESIDLLSPSLRVGRFDADLAPPVTFASPAAVRSRPHQAERIWLAVTREHEARLPTPDRTRGQELV